MKRLKTTDANRLYVGLKNSIDPRDTLIQIMFETGCRVGEAIRLGRDSLEGDYVLITGLKGSCNRRVQISPNLRGKLSRLTTKPLYVRHFSKSKDPESHRRLLTRHFHSITKALLGERWNLHSLRHTAISRLYEETLDIILTQRWAGHKSCNSTSAYIGLEQEERANEIMAKLLRGEA